MSSLTAVSPAFYSSTTAAIGPRQSGCANENLHRHLVSASLRGNFQRHSIVVLSPLTTFDAKRGRGRNAPVSLFRCGYVLEYVLAAPRNRLFAGFRRYSIGMVVGINPLAIPLARFANFSVQVLFLCSLFVLKIFFLKKIRTIPPQAKKLAMS